MSHFVHPQPDALLHPERAVLAEAYRADEAKVTSVMLERAALGETANRRIQAHARSLVMGMISAQKGEFGVDALLHEYDLSSEEGIVLMCLAEALLRVPDRYTADKLIHDKLTASHWETHLGRDRPLFVNAATWGLLLTERIIDTDDRDRWLGGVLHHMVARAGEPVIRTAVRRAMGLLADTFVLGRDIDEALKRAHPNERKGYRYSYDMLGEAARTDADAQAYFEAYRNAIHRVGKAVDPQARIRDRAGVSVKLSALDPRYEPGQEARVMGTVLPRLLQLCELARGYNIALCVDAEESWRLDLSLDVIEAVLAEPGLADWEGFGLAIQAYQKRCYALVGWLEAQAARQNRALMVRLVKGAYWDTEIKETQVQGLRDYPVFTRKAATDVAYLACARRLLSECPHLYPQFATHNAHTVAAVMELAGRQPYEFQRLHGMGEALYEQLLGRAGGPDIPCRIYAPVGSHEELLAYLVRRLLENGANSSFVNRIHEGDVEALVADPASSLRARESLRHPRIPLPRDLYGEQRLNSIGLDFSDRHEMVWLAEAMEAASEHAWRAAPLIDGQVKAGAGEAVHCPADRERQVGRVVWSEHADVEHALEAAVAGRETWANTRAETRARALEQIAELYEAHGAELMALCTREAGKGLKDGIAEVREAADFCRYYAHQARRLFGQATVLPGPTGERNELRLHPRGTFLCISPWNFPLAIFTGQVTAALAAGNTVVAKPAEQASLIAHQAVALMHRAGIPETALHLLPGDGGEIGPHLVADPRISGVAFTGGTDTARRIQQGLAQREGPIVPLIAETGGLNAMVVDSSALPEQVVVDIIRSAFHSAGQRCSALRLLCVQEDIADDLLAMLKGAMDALTVGDPHWLATDVGPVIDPAARDGLLAHHERMVSAGRLLHQAPLRPECERGSFVAPALYRLDRIDQLGREHFGPLLHWVTWRAGELDALVDRINGLGYGLTLGVHSRVDETAAAVVNRARVGNAYVNRDMVGAVVGSQPFGGEGLSGTGFKAGGPHYLLRFAAERVVTVNTAAAGGNASLFAMGEDD
ncbi:bifunctional proline dehydrogenase/L-glutamate gamma-semialdehyde dehydrogenase PutA [Alkalilimnicola ehrlichii]|uniref:bifunctional proline dehydrogenase/L-glutamate gamma-semialdehyde dehydrogenase PutA n=1 Tax=Alkalilimnicola ehrlichii TaxID=351052 RepID=UPI003BA0E37A